MAKTAVVDIIIPTEFEKYVIERTAELSTFGQCGIIEHAPEFDLLAAGGVPRIAKRIDARLAPLAIDHMCTAMTGRA